MDLHNSIYFTYESIKDNMNLLSTYLIFIWNFFLKYDYESSQRVKYVWNFENIANVFFDPWVISIQNYI